MSAVVMSRDGSGFDESPCTVRRDGAAVGLWWREQLWGSGNVTDIIYRGLCAKCEVTLGHAHRLGDLREEFARHLDSGHRELGVTAFLTMSIRAFPLLYRTGGDVLRRTFFVIGNYLAWSEHGGIVSTHEPEDWRERREHRRAGRADFLATLPKDIADKIAPELEAQNESDDAVIDGAATLATDWSITEGEAGKPNSLLTNVPDNVRPDWLSAVEWARSIATRP